MINVDRLCMGCLREREDENAACPYCGYQEDQTQKSPYLAVRDWLMERYLVGKIVANDGEGITYLGWDNITQSAIIIREFLPEGMCGRVAETGEVQAKPGSQEDFSRCKVEFLQRHRLLSRLRDLTALFPTYDIFELNGTAYAISEYVESISLEDFLERNGGSLTFEQTRALMMPAIATLSSLHAAGLVHGGISPENLFVGRDGKLRFGGFAGSELYSSQGALKSCFYPGYTPMEQYESGNMVGPHTDVYAFAATMYRVISGCAPIDAQDRMNQSNDVSANALQGKMPQHAALALMQALELAPEKRTASVEAFRSDFSSAPSVAETRFEEEEEDDVRLLDDFDDYDDEDDDSSERKGKKGVLVTFITMFCTLLAFGLVFAALYLTGVIGPQEATNTPSLLVISSEPTPSVASDSDLTRSVPNFVNKPLEACEKDFGSYEFRVQYKVYHEEVEKGAIISQDPAPGTEFPLEAEGAQVITVVVSLGSGKLKVPELVGLTYGEAIEKLWSAGFPYDSVTCNTGEYYFDSKITKVNPPAGTACGVYDAEVVIYVEEAKEEDEPLTTQDENKEVSSIPAQ
ncbi:MAG: PASTA domain-containing protein [Clostridia bacterium]|nr:PASTA domain-containing protein [Clostridia bacterium]